MTIPLQASDTVQDVNNRDYPRDLKRDLQMCRKAGADVIFTPSDATGMLQLTIVNADGSDRRVITTGTHDSRAPAWRP